MFSHLAQQYTDCVGLSKLENNNAKKYTFSVIGYYKLHLRTVKTVSDIIIAH